jgi:hypothetical protein
MPMENGRLPGACQGRHLRAHRIAPHWHSMAVTVMAGRKHQSVKYLQYSFCNLHVT